MKDSKAVIQGNLEVELFNIDGKSYKIKALLPARVYDWLELADKVQEAETVIAKVKDSKEARKAGKAYVEALQEAVLRYDSDALPYETLKDRISAEELIEAFAYLFSRNDPFTISQLKHAEIMKKQLSGLPDWAIQKGIREAEADVKGE